MWKLPLDNIVGAGRDLTGGGEAVGGETLHTGHATIVVRHDLVIGLCVGLVVGLVVGLLIDLLVGLLVGLLIDLLVGLLVELLVGLLVDLVVRDDGLTIRALNDTGGSNIGNHLTWLNVQTIGQDLCV